MRNLPNFLIIFVLLILFSWNQLFSQTNEISTSIKKDTIIIGEQILLNIKVKTSAITNVLFPIFKDTLSKNIDFIAESKTKDILENNIKNHEKTYLLTSFDTGNIVVPKFKIAIIDGKDTNFLYTTEQKIFVKPFVLKDTLPRDTIRSKYAGFVVRGCNAFEKEIDKQIPDSIKEKISSDSLKHIKEYMKEQFANIFSSQLTQKTGLYEASEIQKIIEAKEHALFIVDKSGILEEEAVLGNLDSLYVQEFDNVEKNQILFTAFKIKDITENLYNTPYNFDEFCFDVKNIFFTIWWILLILVNVIIGLILFKKFYRKKEKLPPIFRKKEIPAHEIALQKLENIRKEKLWASGRFKEYHVQISDTIREYIEYRYNINVTDMTTTEIFEILNIQNIITAENLNLLDYILKLADMVKFAKYSPLQVENNNILNFAFDFVNNTKILL